jgi:hypothetical protein
MRRAPAAFAAGDLGNPGGKEKDFVGPCHTLKAWMMELLPSGNPLPHHVAGGRPVGEKPALVVEQSAFADGHLPTEM